MNDATDDATGAKQEGSSLPVIAQPEAAGKLGEGISARVTSSLDNTGKALAVLAGLGTFFFAAGYYVQWQRFKRGDLPSEEVLALLPRGQIAAAGVKELFISIVFGGALLAVFGWGLVAVARATEGNWRVLRWLGDRLSSREFLLPTAFVGFVNIMIVPWSKTGCIVALTLTLLFLFILFLVQRFLCGGREAKFPLWQLALAVGLAAIVLTGARLWEFTEPRPGAIIQLVRGDAIEGTYVASDSNTILMRVGRTEDSPPRLIVLRKDDVKKVELWKSPFVFERAPSLVDKAAAIFGWDPEFSCIPPECRVGDTPIGPSSAF
ncbi:MAG TPA: hypothetical protein VHF50_07055 [Solirubrobacterales bacterium]|nr:hypothetical protein [Solirubrobacterales bacterium]